MTDRYVALGAVLFLAATGLLFAEPTLLAAAAVPLAFVVYGAVSSLSRSPTVRVERSLTPEDPPPGSRVTVTLTVENPGESLLPDVRVVDDVPNELAVVEGSPRAACSLRGGESTTVEYAVVAKRGEYGFEDPTARLRSLSAERQATANVPAEGVTTLDCTGRAPQSPLPEAAQFRAGTLPTDRGGSGIEFHSVREYRHGDPLRRIDWRRYAKTGELGTVEFREERAVRIALLVDTRPVGRVIREPGYPTGVELSAYAVRRLHDSLTDAGHEVSVGAVGVDGGGPGLGPVTDGLAWATPDDATADPVAVLDAAMRAGDAEGGGRARRRSPVATDGAGYRGRPSRAEAIVSRLRPNAHVVLATPLMDDWPLELARTLAVRGHEFTVVSPDLTGASTPGGTLVAAERSLRVRDVETAGGGVVDWDVDRPLGVALRESLRRLLGGV
jgi:uncharacterized protein (DUF58 family)